MACSSGVCLSNKLLCIFAHDCMLSTHRFILSCLLVFEIVCYLGFGVSALGGVCACVCVLCLLGITKERMVKMPFLQTLR
jgi:hypothetical protein